MNKTIKSKILVKRDTTSNWKSSTTPLDSGELGYSTNGEQLKIGNGSSLWADLPALGVGNLKLTSWGNLTTLSDEFPDADHWGILISVYTDAYYGMYIHTYRTEWSLGAGRGYEKFFHFSFTLADLVAAGCPLSTSSSDPLMLGYDWSTGSRQWINPFLGLTTTDDTQLYVKAWLVDIKD